MNSVELGSIDPIVGVIDSLLTAVVHDRIALTKHLPNKEIIGQGIGNSVAGLFSALAATGAVGAVC